MQTRRSRRQHPQLELFRRQSEVIDWHKLPRETQQKMRKLLANLLRQHSGTQLPHAMVKEGNHE
jgi:hypothetical protein